MPRDQFVMDRLISLADHLLGAEKPVDEIRADLLDAGASEEEAWLAYKAATVLGEFRERDARRASTKTVKIPAQRPNT